MRSRSVALLAVLVPGAAGLLALVSGPAQAYIAGNHCEPLRRR